MDGVVHDAPHLGGVLPLHAVDGGELLALRPALLPLLLPQPPRRLERLLAGAKVDVPPRRGGGSDARCALHVRRARVRLPCAHLAPDLRRRLRARRVDLLPCRLGMLVGELMPHPLRTHAPAQCSTWR
eukprot:scaffold69593_cov48-Phaeocystis_antarctica.AAC.1